MASDKIDIKQAINNPKTFFGTPQNVLDDPRLDRESKIAILKSWERDARELAVAEEEGMTGGEESMLQRVMRAIDKISSNTEKEAGPVTKHGG